MKRKNCKPGVFTREKDLSFLPQGIGDIGGKNNWTDRKRTNFVPTQVTSFSEFENIFGGLDTRFYVPYTVKEYIKNVPAVTIVRVLGIGGYQHSSIRLTLSGSIASSNAGDLTAVLKPSRGGLNLDLGGPTSASLSGTPDFIGLL